MPQNKIRENKRSEKQQRNHNVKVREGEGQRCSTVPEKGLKGLARENPSQVDMPWRNCTTWRACSKAGPLSVGSLCQSRGKTWEGRSSRKKLSCTMTPLSPLTTWEGAQEWSSAWERGEKKCYFHVCVSALVSHYNLTGNKLNSVTPNQVYFAQNSNQ